MRVRPSLWSEFDTSNYKEERNISKEALCLLDTTNSHPISLSMNFTWCKKHKQDQIIDIIIGNKMELSFVSNLIIATYQIFTVATQLGEPNPLW